MGDVAFVAFKRLDFERYCRLDCFHLVFGGHGLVTF